MPDHADSRPAEPEGSPHRAPVVVYDTEVRAGGRWQAAAPLSVHLDRGEPCEVVELGWRSESGAEAEIAFHGGMTAFRGHRRTADGARQEYRGVERARWSGPEQMSGFHPRTFATEEEAYGDRTVTGRLRMVLDDGAGPVERITWRDHRDTFASVAVRSGPAPARTVPAQVQEVRASDEHRAAGEVAGKLLAEWGKWLAFEPTATLDFVLPEPAAVTAYQLTAANDYRDRDPQDWRLRGSVDGRTWFTVDSRQGQAFPERHQNREYSVANSAAYPLYRLDISRNWGMQPETQLQRVRLLTADEPELGTPVPVSRVSASGENRDAGEVAANLLHSTAGKWLAFTGSARLEFVLPEPTAVTAYSLTSADDHCSRDPKDWVMQGSHDGSTWTTLDRRSGEAFPERFLVREFAMAEAAPYSRYRLLITANAEGVGEIQLNRVQLLARKDGWYPALGGFSGVLRRSYGPVAGYRGTPVAERIPGPDSADGATAAADGRRGESAAEARRFVRVSVEMYTNP
ncbi:coagulation factor 5/8 type domain-containing protein [Streptomonospora litoralis]|uniref:F5/8 type C domain protein n=1 Tax=Streptomonospora litoralis TaxID=2498135 RepID=A0A4P6Q668_9ACTN|nr:coagulation factor 5/8 type domain-containing protein [Streptomonospora litoralis]QBI56205.1 F5/8 type C domain protein [Streptomonospora litoralis]